MRKVYTTGQVARILSCSSRTVAELFDCGKLQGYRLDVPSRNHPGKKFPSDRRIPRESLVKYMKEVGIPMSFMTSGDRAAVLFVGVDNRTKETVAPILDDRLFSCVFAETAFEAGILFVECCPSAVIVDTYMGRSDALGVGKEVSRASSLVVLFNEDEVDPAGVAKSVGATFWFKRPFDAHGVVSDVISHVRLGTNIISRGKRK